MRNYVQNILSHMLEIPNIYNRSIYIRENSLEYNQPTITYSKSTNLLSTLICCGNSMTDLTVRDSISVIYYDDIVMDTVRNDTRKCHECYTFCCGGRGEAVRLESTFCGNLCYRGRGGGVCCFCCVPVCFPEWVCPCGTRVSVFCMEKRLVGQKYLYYSSCCFLSLHLMVLRKQYM